MRAVKGLLAVVIGFVIGSLVGWLEWGIWELVGVELIWLGGLGLFGWGLINGVVALIRGLAAILVLVLMLVGVGFAASLIASVLVFWLESGGGV